MSNRLAAPLSKEAKTQRANSWRLDSETGRRFVPQGEFRPTARYGMDDGPAGRLIPALVGDFDPVLFDVKTSGLPLKCGFGMEEINGAASLNFRIQRGPDMLCWYANPSDPLIWEALDEWGTQRCATFAVELPDGENFTVRIPYEHHHQLQPARFPSSFPEELRKALSAAYVQHIAAGIVTGESAAKTKSLLQGFPLRHVQECIVRTNNTPPVLVKVGQAGQSMHSTAMP